MSRSGQALHNLITRLHDSVEQIVAGDSSLITEATADHLRSVVAALASAAGSNGSELSEADQTSLWEVVCDLWVRWICVQDRGMDCFDLEACANDHS